MTFDFQISLDVAGVPKQRVFTVSARSLTEAVNQSMCRISQEMPNAAFSGLTYYHPPLPMQSYEKRKRAA